MKRLHSLAGVFPLGAFLILHLGTNAQALAGSDAFARTLSAWTNHALAPFVEVALVFVPLAFHASYGSFVALTRRGELESNADRTSLWLQRASGIVALVFVVTHLVQYRFQRFNGKLVARDFHTELCASLSSTVAGIPWMALGYLVGIAASVFHFSHGLRGFCRTWGLARSERSERIVAVLATALGVLLFALGAVVVIYFATGSRPWFLDRRAP